MSWERQSVYRTKSYTATLHHGLQPSTLLYTIFDRNGTSFIYCLLTNVTPLHIPSLEHFNCCKCTIFLICINNKTRKLSYLFTAIKYICWPFLSFHRAKWQIFLHQLMKSLPSRISEGWKRYTFGQSSGIDHYREYPLEGLMCTLVPLSGRQWWLCVFFRTCKQNNHTDYMGEPCSQNYTNNAYLHFK